MTVLVIAATVESAAEWVVDSLQDTFEHRIREAGSVNVSLAGGSSPRVIYELLASPSWRSRFEWQRVRLFQSDERHVPPDDSRSNHRMVRESLLERVPIPRAQVHLMPTGGELQEDAAAYGRLLLDVLPATELGTPQHDWMLLGMGPDGHTASLFPGSNALQVADATCVGVVPPDAPSPRISVTLPVLNAAREVVVFAPGAVKAAALSRALGEGIAGDPVPARLLRPGSGRLVFVTDVDGAADIDTRALRPGARKFRVR